MKKVMLWIKRYIMFCGIIMICSFFMCLFFDPTRELNVASYFGQCMVFAGLALLTVGVYYSKEELTQEAWWCRTILHLILLEAVFLPLAHYWHFWYNATDACVYAVFILIGKIIWHIVDFGRNAKTAADVNKKIRERRKASEKEEGKII